MHQDDHVQSSPARWLPLLLIVFLALAVVAGNAEARAQESPVVVDGRPSCGSCKIVLRELVRILSSDERVDIGGSFGPAGPSVAIDSKGRYYVTVNRGTQVAVFDSRGQRTALFGRPGDGPGEFRGIVKIMIGPHDSVFVRDRNKVVVFGPLGTYARSIAIESRFSVFAVIGDGAMIAAATGRDRRSALVVLARNGDSVSVMGPTPRPLSASCRLVCASTAFLRTERDDGIWAVPANEYTLTPWGLRGQLGSTVTVQSSSWFEPWNRDPSQSDLIARPNSTLSGVHSDSGGRLWVIGSTAASDWRPFSGQPTGAITVRGVQLSRMDSVSADVERYRATRGAMIVDVVDVAARRVLASSRFNGATFTQLRGNLVYSVETSELGVVALLVSRLEFAQ